jgi:hypothetical protein
VAAFEVALCGSFGLLSEENQELLGDDRQHFNVDTIELIETAPGTGRGKAFEELTNHDVVHGVGAVEDDTLFSQGFSKILSGLSFSSTSRPGRSTPKIEFQGTHQGHITLISERSDNQPEGVSQILIPIREVGLNAPDITIIINPVIPQLADPLKRSDVLHILFHHLFHHVLGMHINNDQRINSDFLLFGERLTH